MLYTNAFGIFHEYHFSFQQICYLVQNPLKEVCITSFSINCSIFIVANLLDLQEKNFSAFKEPMDSDKAKFILPDGSTLDVSQNDCNLGFTFQIPKLFFFQK